MAQEDVAKFFAQVYQDKALQGALHHALVAAAPDVVTEIARQKGFTVAREDLVQILDPQTAELSDDELEAVAGGAVFQQNLATVSLKKNFWPAVSPSRFGGFGDVAAFNLGIPGPSFVNVMSEEQREDTEPESNETSVSAAELYESLD